MIHLAKSKSYTQVSSIHSAVFFDSPIHINVFGWLVKVRNRATSAPTYSLGLRAHLLSQPSSLALWCHVLSFNILGSENQFRSCSSYCINKRIYHQVQNSMVISGHMQQNQPCPFSYSTIVVRFRIVPLARYSLVPGISASVRRPVQLRSSSVELSGGARHLVACI